MENPLIENVFRKYFPLGASPGRRVGGRGARARPRAPPRGSHVGARAHTWAPRGHHVIRRFINDSKADSIGDNKTKVNLWENKLKEPDRYVLSVIDYNYDYIKVQLKNEYLESRLVQLEV